MGSFTPLLGLFLLAFTVVPVAAQGGVAGQVTDADTGRPLVGAMVTIQGLTAGTTTGSDGSFVLRDVPKGEHFVIARHIGYETYSVFVQVGDVPGDSAATFADLPLRRGDRGIALGEVEITGTGATRAVKLVFPLAAFIAALLLIAFLERRNHAGWSVTLGASVAGAGVGAMFAGLWLAVNGSHGGWVFLLQGTAIGTWLGIWRSRIVDTKPTSRPVAS